VLQQWGGIWGQTPAIPTYLDLPSGDRVQGPQVGATYQGYTLYPWWMDRPTTTGE